MADFGKWIMHWTTFEGKQLASAFETTEKDVLLAACKQRRDGGAVRFILGPRGRMISAQEIDKFCSNYAGP